MTVVDPQEVVRTAAEAARCERPPLLVLEPLQAYLAAQGLAAAGDALRWQRIGDGHSNVTYLLETGERRLVLRRGPRPPLPPTTHDMVREARIQRLLADAGVAVPHIVALCEDTGILGVPFYLMEHLDGFVVTGSVPPALAAEPAAIAYAAVDALADLHAVDVSTGGLATIGRPEGYLSRQVERFAALWPSVSRRPSGDLDVVAERLRTSLPVSSRASVVHGDYRIGNLMFGAAAPARIQAILDWEMATLGDPLADVGYFLATYAEPGATVTPLELTSVTRSPAFPRRADLAARYAQRTGADLGDIGWYEALALFKAAVFCEAIYTRWTDGERPGDTFAPALETGVPLLIDEARRVFER